ncbi:Thymidine kinase, cytosolic [Acipenser ruthenus]|uniref:Thymidine kinase n=1 Tax=Acipenser ruthenus TaxID=7906 RepID=A0A444UQF4_ACIRT|nr:Thymidine kinase, cytosolic [Acipenser ruthenus]
MRRVRRFQVAQYRCLVVKYAKDTRYSDNGVATHDRNTMEAVPASQLKEVYKQALVCCVIGIDEGQFFPDTVEFCEEMANRGKTIIVAALDGTFQRKAFGNILNLVPLAESVVKLNAVCMECFREAAYTKRLGAEKKAAGSVAGECPLQLQKRLDDAIEHNEDCTVKLVEVIGGTDKYHAVCRACYSAALPSSKVNHAPHKRIEETPPQTMAGKQVDIKAPRKLFETHFPSTE